MQQPSMFGYRNNWCYKVDVHYPDYRFFSSQCWIQATIPLANNAITSQVNSAIGAPKVVELVVYALATLFLLALDTSKDATTPSATFCCYSQRTLDHVQKESLLNLYETQ
jgi:hypothetical protein